jgi:hypothetical protein
MEISLCEYYFAVIGKILAEGIRYVMRVRHRSLVQGRKPIMEFFDGGEWPGFLHVLETNSSIGERTACDIACAFDVSTYVYLARCRDAVLLTNEAVSGILLELAYCIDDCPKLATNTQAVILLNFWPRLLRCATTYCFHVKKNLVSIGAPSIDFGNWYIVLQVVSNRIKRLTFCGSHFASPFDIETHRLEYSG